MATKAPKLATAAQVARLARRVRMLEEVFEDRLDIAESERRLAREKPVPYARARKRVGLA